MYNPWRRLEFFTIEITPSALNKFSEIFNDFNDLLLLNPNPIRSPASGPKSLSINDKLSYKFLRNLYKCIISAKYVQYAHCTLSPNRVLPSTSFYNSQLTLYYSLRPD